ncbi:nucleotide sugar dehydrogenase [Kerstersia similis]|uniref:nucleotide sugar dehydrogenase n=1 Tax=Kerstersia similis TaxID=206505 RepID=UPI0039EDF68D
MKIAVAGTGYVGLSNAVLLAQANEVLAYDIDERRVGMINRCQSPIADPEIGAFLASGRLSLKATTDPQEAFAGAAYVVIATPTDYDPETNGFDTRSVKQVAAAVRAWNPDAEIIIKSTVPVGFTIGLRQELDFEHITFSPEFLREGRALQDNLHPSRIIVGGRDESARNFGRLLREGAHRKNVPELYTDSTEAEAIKLFANTYLAMRIAFFNELDTYAQIKQLDTRQLIEGLGLDPRIGMYYNNPSFGYGGYCLPKDTRQLLSNYADVPNCLMRAIVDANALRKQFIVRTIVARAPSCVGIYRLVMKEGADNFRESAVLDIIRGLLAAGLRVLIHEPGLSGGRYMGCELEPDLAAFKARCEVVLANRRSEQLEDIAANVYSRDVFGMD